MRIICMVFDIVKLLNEAVSKIIFFYDHPYIIGITLALRVRERERKRESKVYNTIVTSNFQWDYNCSDYTP